MLPERSWLSFAREDLRMADLAFRDEMFNQVCFHAQQAAEKCLKAVLHKKGQLPPKTHKIIDLLTVLTELDLGELRETVLLLDRFYIPTRYPDALPGGFEEGLPTAEDAREALDTAARLLRTVESQMAV